MPLPVIAIFDVGKTNKKILLFDEQYNLQYEESKQLPETIDEDGFPCEDVALLTEWIKVSLAQLLQQKQFQIKAVNFSAYGASFVCLNNSLQPFLPLYNYLKPYPEELQNEFYTSHGGELLVAKETASPVLGSLNSGMQLYRLKYQKEAAFNEIKYALHLPQYLSFILTSNAYSDITSIGCHTNLWHFANNNYHPWVTDEGIINKLAPILPCTDIAGYNESGIPVGVGLHDSSAALIPYLYSFKEPFVLISTGTWCISLNPFNNTPLTDDELQNDCLCYLTYQGKPVKASRLFAGHEHEQQTKRLASYFNKPTDYFSTVHFSPSLLPQQSNENLYDDTYASSVMKGQSKFNQRALESFHSYEQAYHQLIADIIEQQLFSITLVLHNSPVDKIFVDGGFSNNQVYMHLLASALPDVRVFAASVPQASALGAAMVISQHWNTNPLPSNNIIQLKHYPSS